MSSREVAPALSVMHVLALAGSLRAKTIEQQALEPAWAGHDATWVRRT